MRLIIHDDTVFCFAGEELVWAMPIWDYHIECHLDGWIGGL